MTKALSNTDQAQMDQLLANLSIEMVTPDKAREFLANSITNRNLRMADVETYARDMTQGDWEFNYDPLRFTDDGHLLDGQHRLHAIILTGIPIPMLIVKGFNKSQQMTMDTGVPRKFHDLLKIRGEHQYFDLAALLRKISAIEDTGSIWLMDSKRYKPSNYRMLRMLDKDPNIRGIINKVYQCRDVGLPKSVAGALWYQFSKISIEDTYAFFTKFTVGANLDADDPVFVLRKVLMNNNNIMSNRGGTTMWKAALTIKAWNAFRDGEKIQALTWRRGGAAPEKFPDPH